MRRPSRPHAVASLVLCLAGLCPVVAAGAGRPVPDEDADEKELADIKAALRQDQPAPPPEAPPPPSTGALARLADWLPEVGAIAELVLAYSTEHVGDAGDRGVTALAAPGAGGALPAPGALLRIELSLHKVVEGYFRLDAFGLLSTSGLSLLEASASTLTLPFKLQLRAGLLLHRFGVQNSWHPHQLSLIGRPLAIDRAFGPSGGSGLGAEASWRAPLPWLAEIAAAALSASGAGAGSFYGEAPPPGPPGLGDAVYVVTLKQHVPIGRLGASLGLSLALGPNPSGRRNRSDVYGADLALRLRGRRGLRVDLLSEWLWRRRQVPAGLLQDLSGYGELGLRLPPSRFELRLRLRYEYGGPVADEPLWARERHRLAVGADLALGRTAVLRLQGLIDLYGLEEPAGSSGPAPGASEAVAGFGGIFALQLRLGPHGLREADPHGLQL